MKEPEFNDKYAWTAVLVLAAIGLVFCALVLGPLVIK